MKKLILPILILISIRSMGQCDSAMMGEVLGIASYNHGDYIDSNGMPYNNGVPLIRKGGGDNLEIKTQIAFTYPIAITNRTDTAKLSFSTYTGTISIPKRMVFRSCEDSFHLYQHETKNYDSKVKWDFEANRDSIKFITPPHKIIIGHTSYTSMFLNGSWILLMDYKDVN